MSDDFAVSPELLGIYIEDARAHLDGLDVCLLSLERDGHDPEVVAQVLGPLHTLKGNSGMLGFSGIKDFVHRLEDVFAHVQDGGLVLTREAFDQLFASASALRDAVEKAVAAGEEVRSLAPEKAMLERLAAAAEGGAPLPKAAPAAPKKAAPPPVAIVQSAPVAPVAQPEADLGAPKQVDTQYVAARSSMVRVDFAQLDQLLNLVGELIIYRTKLYQAGKQMGEKLGNRDEARDLLDAVHHVANVSTQLQETVMDIRMLPIKHVFERFPRLVRDLARSQGKDIELILEGEGTRVDKAIIDEIGEPLVHMIRNSVDHGIEMPDVRQARGKTRTGTILLSAMQESNHVVITIMDDGGGIDAQQVRRKAISRGLIKADDQLTEREIVHLIFAQGFSTADKISDLSGRGVGLDVVLKSIERLNGLVEVETVPGVGTKFIIQLPLTLAIISALLVEVAGRPYAVPLGSVVESIKFSPDEVHRINNRETLRIRERIVPLVRLAQWFGFEETTPAGQDNYAVILGRGDRRLGLVVDRLRGQQEVVIKALDAALAAPHLGLAGATIMGDGRVVLIVDVAAFFDAKRHAGMHSSSLIPADF